MLITAWLFVQKMKYPALPVETRSGLIRIDPYRSISIFEVLDQLVE